MKDRFKGAGGWHERLIDVHPQNLEKLTYSIAPAPISKADQDLLPQGLPDFKDEDLLEVNLGLGQIIDEITPRFKAHPCAALFIDYGPDETEFGDTFQALKKHEKVYPLDEPGMARFDRARRFRHPLCTRGGGGPTRIWPPPRKAHSYRG